MYVVGEIERRGAAGQIDYFPLRRERIHAILEELRAHLLEKLPVGLGSGLRAAILGVRLEQPPHPLDLALILCIGRRSLLVGPVRGDAELGVLVHLAGADLHLDTLALGSDYRGVDGAIEVAFGCGNVVVELARDVGPEPMDHAERGVAVADGRDDDAYGANVEELLEGELLTLHLSVDAVHVLWPSVDLRLDAGALKLRTQSYAELLDVLLPVGSALVESACDPPVFLRLEVS